jgi:predicted outer membrane repeat protein
LLNSPFDRNVGFGGLSLVGNSGGPVAFINSPFLTNTSFAATLNLTVSALTISNSNVTGHDYTGVTIQTLNGPLSVSDSRFENNGSGLFIVGGTGGPVTFDNSPFLTNTLNGGAQLWQPVMGITLTNSPFVSNTSSYSGGGLYLYQWDGPFTLMDSPFSSNTSSADGGGMYANGGTGGAITILNSPFEYNTATNGGGVYLIPPATFTGGVFQNNLANNSGGAISAAYVSFTGTQFVANFANAAGGGVFTADTFDLTGTQFLSNTAGYGGGLYSASAAGGEIVDTLFAGNTAFIGGGAWLNGPVNAAGTTFTDNTAYYGGGLYAASTVGGELVDMLFAGNTAHDGGGGAWFNGPVNATDTTFVGNIANDGGGAWFNSSASAAGLTFTGNMAYINGGGVYAADEFDLTDTQFFSNTAGHGGGAWFKRSTNVANTIFTGNTAYYGGGIYAADSLGLIGTQFLSNTAVIYGGGLYAFGAAGGELVDTFFAGNTAYDGGGAWFNGPANVADTTFTDNIAGNSGGGMFAADTLNLTSTQFLSNKVGAYGGGIYFYNAVASQLVNVLFARNFATRGAAIYVANANPLSLIHVTVASPTSVSGEAITVNAGTVNITNTIIASHTTGINNSGGTVYEDYNLFFGNSLDMAGTFVAGSGANDVVSGDPKFIDPANDNYHLGADSAAIDVGANAGVTTDFDHDPRPQGFGTDIGYDEVLQYCNGSLATNTNYPLSSSPVVTVAFSATGNVNCLAAVYFPRGHAYATGTIGNGVGADHFWQIAARNSSGITATGFIVSITLPYNGFASPKLCFYPGALSGSGWDCTGAQSTNGNTITRAGLTHFSDWAVGNDVGPTAITLTQFTAQSSSSLIGFVLMLIVLALIGSGGWLRRRTRLTR